DKLRRGIILGDPGLGKTWLLKWEAARHAASTAQKVRQTGSLIGVTIPIYRRLTDLAESLHTPPGRPSFPDGVIAALRGYELSGTTSHFSRPIPESLLDLIRQQIGTSECLLLLDALDEVPTNRRDRLIEVLRDWMPKNPQARVLLTSRLVGYVEPPWPF